jgi:hypothetical protein
MAITGDFWAVGQASPVSPLEEPLQVGIVEEAVGIARFSVIAEGVQTLAPACPKRSDRKFGLNAAV